MSAPHLDRLADFVADISALLDQSRPEADVVTAAAARLVDLLMVDDWLPDEYARGDLVQYRQYLLYRDPHARFCVVSFVWGPGQKTPVHDHTVWGVVGVLRGAELTQSYDVSDGLRPKGPPRCLTAGAVEALAPSIGDIHQVANAFDDRSTVSIHLYGGDIGGLRRSTYDQAGVPSPFVSGYANAAPPELSLVRTMR